MVGSRRLPRARGRAKGEGVAFRAPGHPRSARRPAEVPRWPRRVVPAAVAAAVIIALGVVASVWTNLLWYRSVGHVGTFAVTFGTEWALFAVAAVFMGGVIGGNAWLAYRVRPAPSGASPEQPGPEASFPEGAPEDAGFPRRSFAP